MYRVINFFHDLQDKNHPYKVGDEYPRKGIEVTEERIQELASDKNKQRKPLIKLVGEAQGETENVEKAPEETPKKTSTKRTAKKTAEK